MPAVDSVHIDQGLTNLSILYMNDSFVAEMIAPPLPVDKRSDKYFVYDKEAALRGSGVDANGRPNSLRRPKTVAAEVDFSLSTDQFYADEYARRSLVTDAEVATADSPLQPDIDATMLISEKLKIDNEIGTAGIACKSGNYPTSNKVLLTTGGTGTSWAQYASANSKPLTNIRDAKVAVKKGILKEANYALYSMETALTLADHPDVKELIKYTNEDALMISGLPRVIRGLNTIEGSAQKATNEEGKAFTSGSIWSDENGTNISLIFHRAPTTGPRTVHFMRTFDAPDATTKVRGVGVRRYREEALKGQWIEASMTRDWKMVAIDANSKAIGGYLIQGTTL